MYEARHRTTSSSSSSSLHSTHSHSQPLPMYCRLLHACPTTATPPLSSLYTFKTQAFPFFKHQFTPNNSSLRTPLSLNQTPVRTQTGCTAHTDGGAGNWTRWIPSNIVSADKVLRLISDATSSPIGQFISSPTTFLHSLDPRIKLAWLLALVILPARSNIPMRFGIVLYLALLCVLVLPTHVWMDQLGRVSLLSGILFIMLALGTDGVSPLVQLRNPPPSVMGFPNIPESLQGYSYVIMKLGPLQLTRKGLSAASRSACLTFTIFQSASLCLATTTPEQLAYALQWFILPLTNFGAPVAEVILTLLLSMRFMNLVLDEVRNVALGILSRRINWQQLTIMETIDVFFTYIRRVFKSILSHAEQISQAMIARGFRGDSNAHKIYLPSDSSIGVADILSLLCLLGLVGATAVF